MIGKTRAGTEVEIFRKTATHYFGVWDAGKYGPIPVRWGINGLFWEKNRQCSLDLIEVDNVRLSN